MFEVTLLLLVIFLSMTKVSRWSLIIAMALGVLFSFSRADRVHMLSQFSGVILSIIGLDVGISLFARNTSWRNIGRSISATFASLITLTAVSWTLFWVRPSMTGFVLACASTSVVTGPALIRLQEAQASPLYTLVLRIAATDDFFAYLIFSIYVWRAQKISLGAVSVIFVFLFSMIVALRFSSSSIKMRSFRAVVAGVGVAVGLVFAQPLLSSVAAGLLIKSESLLCAILEKLARALAPAYFFLTFSNVDLNAASNVGSLPAAVGMILFLLLVSRISATLIVNAQSRLLFAVATYPRGVVALAIANSSYESHLFSASLYTTFLAAVLISNAIVVAIFQPLYTYSTRATR